MYTIRSSYLLRVLTGLLLSSGLHAQELTLFEPFETEPGEQAIAGPQQPVFTMGNGQPAYTLRSVSRFGDRYQAVLISRSGEVANVSWGAGESTPVQGMGGFTVVSMASGTVALQHPPGDACVSAALSGVECNGNLAQLSLAVAAPLASNGIVAPPVPQQGDPFANAPMGPNPGFVDPAAGNGQNNGPQVFINPFSGAAETMPAVSEQELQARQQRQAVRAARLRQFDQQQDAAVDAMPPPAPGFERVTTPFGVRDIPIRE
jgi:hypothetical protein